ncbi:MAG TPA: DUF4783 domain-containing protein [Thermoanaerobaculia bacterium]|nr:DUF4783 domain-containing protein [Thermoanaerobaculia bacterium]
MKLWTRVAFVLLFVPLVASAQFRDLDAAMSNLERGFGSGDVDAIVAGIAADDQVMLQFPGLADKSGFFGRDQAAYLLDGLFNKVDPSGFERVKVQKVSAEGQYHITAKWTINNGSVNLFVTLRQKDGKWSIASVRSAGD